MLQGGGEYRVEGDKAEDKKTINSKMTTNSQLSTIEPKNKNKLSNQLEQEQNHRNGDHMEGYQWEGRGKWGKRYRE